MAAHTWYETCVVVAGEHRDIWVRGNQEGAARAVDSLRQRWPEADMIFVRQHRKGGTFRVIHKLTWKREAA